MRITISSGRGASWACGVLALLVGVGAAPANDLPRLAVLDFELVDTSLQGEVEGADPAEAARLHMIEAELRAQLEASGRYRLVDITPAAEQIEDAGYLWSCNGCEVGIAKGLDADLVLTGWVQKVSNLILNLNLVIRDTQTRERVFASSVDIRGNTDESWQHGIRYLLKNRLLKE
jgi:hypothetical protein